MSDTQVSTVTLNMDGTFTPAATAGAAAGAKLAGSLEGVAKSAKTAGDAVKASSTEVKKSGDDMDALGGAAKKVGGAFSTLPGIIGDATKAAMAFASAGGPVGVAVLAITTAVGAAKKLFDEMSALKGAVFDVAKEYGLLGSKMALFETSKRELQSSIGGKLGGSYDVTRRESLKMGVDPDASWEISKKLLGDKFSQAEIPGILKIKAGMDLEGQNGEAFITTLQKLKLEPKVKAADLDRLYKMGIDSNKVYADLAKRMGTDIPTATAKVKAGTADTAKVIESLESVAKERFGATADLLGNAIPTLIARAKGAFDDLFTGVNIKPVKDVLHRVIAELEGGDGKALKAAVSDLFGSAFGVAFGDLNKGDTVGDAFRQITKGVQDAAKEIRSLRPEVKALLDDLRKAMHDGTIKSLVDLGKGAAKKEINSRRDELKATTAKAKLSTGQADFDINSPLQPLFETSETFQKFKRTIKPLRKILGTENEDDLAEDAGTKKGKVPADKLPLLLNGDDQMPGAMDAGDALPAGMAEGIRAGESQAIEAAADMAEKALQAAKDKLAIHSPSAAFGDEVGSPSAEGMSNAMASHPGPERAGKAMASNALGGAKGEAGKASGISGGGAGGGVTYNITMGAGATDADLARLEAMLRKVDRARAEGGAMPAYG